MKILVAYVPVLHEGYVKLFCESKANRLFVLGEDVVASIPELDYVSRKDSLRAISSEKIAKAINSWVIFESVSVLNLSFLGFYFQNKDIIMPDEDVSRLVAKRYFPNHNINFKSIFLRWDKQNTTKQIDLICESVSASDFEKMIMGLAIKETQKSSDWWRHVGAVVIKDGNVIMTAFNRHLPTEQNPYIFGDPRAVFKKGINIDLSTSQHAEARIIAEAARRGISLEGTDLFVTDFPCPPCAKLVAYSGIKKCYFLKGYAMLDGEDILKDQNVKIIRINL